MALFLGLGGLIGYNRLHKDLYCEPVMKKIIARAFITACFILSAGLLGCGESNTTSSSLSPLPPDWFYCAQDKDCLIIEGLCGTPIGINSEFKDKAIAHFKSADAFAACGPKPAAQKNNAQCIYHETPCKTLLGGSDNSKKCMSAHKECVVFNQIF